VKHISGILKSEKESGIMSHISLRLLWVRCSARDNAAKNIAVMPRVGFEICASRVRGLQDITFLTPHNHSDLEFNVLEYKDLLINVEKINDLLPHE